MKRVLLSFAAVAAFTGCPPPSMPPDAGPPAIDWTVQAPFEAPADQLAGTGLAACATLDSTRCMGTTLQRCAIMDKASKAPAPTPDPLLKRVLTYERWYELFHSPDGQTANRIFVGSVDAGAAEADWGSPRRFHHYGGLGDAAIWSGVALNGYIQRYLVTGADADYRRMEDKVRALLTHFEVTGLPGYLARYHFVKLPANAPPIDKHVTGLEYGEMEPPSFKYNTIANPGSVVGLPPDYLSGVTDPDGGVWMGTPMWKGNPSIDQYSGATVSLPAAYGLLKDAALKARIATHLTCYLKRLKRLELHNVQKSRDAVAAMKALLGADSDVSKIDTLVMYYLPQYNSKSAATYEKGCPASVSLTPSLVVDAASSTFEIDLLGVIGDLSQGDRATSVDHYYIPNARGADSVHLMNLAAMAYWFTGEDQYKKFMDDELLAAMKANEVARTINAGKPNKWCRKYFDSHISVPVVWALVNQLGPSTLRTQMESVLWDECWLKDGLLLDNAKFGLMAASRAPAGTDTSGAVTQSMRQLNNLGGNGGVLLDPRRTYTLPYDRVTGAGIMTECPSETQRVDCEVGPKIFGFTPLATKITGPCTGGPGECQMDGGVCAGALSKTPLPVELRPWEDFIWQRSPFNMGFSRSPEADEQSPGVDLIEEYWLARHYHLTSAGEGQVLAWHDEGTCP